MNLCEASNTTYHLSAQHLCAGRYMYCRWVLPDANLQHGSRAEIPSNGGDCTSSATAGRDGK